MEESRAGLDRRRNEWREVMEISAVSASQAWGPFRRGAVGGADGKDRSGGGDQGARADGAAATSREEG